MEQKTETAMVPYEAGAFDIPDDSEHLAETFAENLNLPEYSGKANLQINGNSGSVTYGLSDREEVDPSDRFIVDVGSYSHGYRLWLSKPDGGGAPPQQVMANQATEKMEAIKARLPDKNSFAPLTPSNNGDWKPAVGFMLLGITGEPAGTPLEFITDTAGGIGRVGELTAAIKAQKAKNPAKIYPVVCIGSEPFTTKKYKTKTSYKPVFTIVDFIGPQEFKAILKQLREGPPPAADEDVIDVVATEIKEPATGRRKKA